MKENFVIKTKFLAKSISKAGKKPIFNTTPPYASLGSCGEAEAELQALRQPF